MTLLTFVLIIVALTLGYAVERITREEMQHSIARRHFGGL